MFWQTWLEREWKLHINVLEMRAIKNACQPFLGKFRGKKILLMADASIMLAYLQLGRHVIVESHQKVHGLLDWMEDSNSGHKEVSFVARCYPPCDEQVNRGWVKLLRSHFGEEGLCAVDYSRRYAVDACTV